MKSIHTRVKYSLVGGDFSAQEPRLTANASQDDNMLNAYLEGKDLYSVIASLAFNKPYDECKEFYPEFHEIVIDGKKIIAGTGKEFSQEVLNSSIELPKCYFINTSEGFVKVEKLKIGDIIISDTNRLVVEELVEFSKTLNDNLVSFFNIKFTVLN